MDPVTIVAGLSLLWNIYQSVKKKQYKKALDGVVMGVEIAEQNGMQPKAAIALRTAGTVAGVVLDKVLQEKGLKDRSKRSVPE